MPTKKELQAEVRRLRKQNAKPKPAGKKPVKGPSNPPQSSGIGVALGAIAGVLVVLAVLFGLWLLMQALQPAAAPTGPSAPVAAPADPAVPAGQAEPEANTSNDCRDGSPTGNPKNRIDRTPVGTAEFWTVQEISTKPGKGFAGFDRWIQVTAPLGDTDQVFSLNVETIHEVKYCGSRTDVIAYLSDVNTHVWAMRQTAADSSGTIPPEGEIPVVLIDSATGTVTFLVAPTAGSAPTLELIKSHVEVVHLQQ